MYAYQKCDPKLAISGSFLVDPLRRPFRNELGKCDFGRKKQRREYKHVCVFNQVIADVVIVVLILQITCYFNSGHHSTLSLPALARYSICTYFSFLYKQRSTHNTVSLFLSLPSLSIDSLGHPLKMPTKTPTPLPTTEMAPPSAVPPQTLSQAPTPPLGPSQASPPPPSAPPPQ